MKSFDDMKEEAVKKEKMFKNKITCHVCGREIEAHWDYCYYCGFIGNDKKKGK